MFSSVLASMVCFSSVVSAARIKRVDTVMEAGVFEKQGVGDSANIYVSFNQSYTGSTQNHGNNIGTVIVKFTGGNAQFTNQGFMTSPPPGWQNGMCLGKADEYIWAIPPTQQGVAMYTFDHGVSDLVFGDAQGSGMFRPEFDEKIYQNPNFGMQTTAQNALMTQLQEEQKESTLKFGNWQRDGYFQGGMGGSFQYTPRLKVKDGSSFEKVGKLGSAYQSATLQRPTILDIDNLFSARPLVPTAFRTVQEVQQDRSYQGGMQGGMPGQFGGMPNGGMGMPTHGQQNTGYNPHGGMPMQGHGQMPTQGYGPNNGYNNGYNNGMQGGNMGGYRPSYLEVNGTEVAQTDDVESTGTLPVEISVQWLTPVLQKYQCVSVAAQYAKTGGQSLFLAMGWDTESGISDLDLDLSLVAVNKMKQVILPKTVFYHQKAPPALSCGQNIYGMQAFNDDRSGDEPGDDEIVKVNLGCLGQHHPDVEALVVVVSIYQPNQLTWQQIDSAYLRIISGGQEVAASGNFFVRDAEAVRSFVRLSGNDLKEDPGLAMNSIAVGMFFRQPSETGGSDWAFATLMRGMQGKNAPEVQPSLQAILADLVYPANAAWDKTTEQQELNKQGAFGEVGIHGKATVNGLIAGGKLPCVSSKTDQAKLIMGHMTPTDLQKVVDNPSVPQDAKKFAQVMQNPKVAEKVQGMAQGVEKMEKANTEEERKQIANDIGKTEVKPPTQEESNEAMDDLGDLFDTI